MSTLSYRYYIFVAKNSIDYEWKKNTNLASKIRHITTDFLYYILSTNNTYSKYITTWKRKLVTYCKWRSLALERWEAIKIVGNDLVLA